MHKRAEKWPWVTWAGNKRFWPTWTARSKWGKEPVEKAQLIERSLRYAAGSSRKLTLGLRRYFQVLNSEKKVSGSPVVFCRCSQGFLALLLLFSIHVRTPNIQQAPERTQPLLKSLREKRRKITSPLQVQQLGNFMWFWCFSCVGGEQFHSHRASHACRSVWPLAELCFQWKQLMWSVICESGASPRPGSAALFGLVLSVLEATHPRRMQESRFHLVTAGFCKKISKELGKGLE